VTLILSCVTDEFVVQVSDRCLSDLRTGRPIEQEANKAVFLSNRVVFGFTGLAEIEGKPADIWLRNVLAPYESVGHGVQLVVDEATRAFADMRVPRASKRQAFVGVGWARFDEAIDRLSPFGVVISNAYSDAGWLSEARPEFVGDVRFLPSPGGSVWTDLGGLPVRRKADLHRMVRRVVDRRLTAAGIADLFIRETRAMADLDQRIGRGLMISSIPRAATETQDLLALSSLPTESELTFAHMRHDDSIDVLEGPHVVRPGWRVFSNFSHRIDADGAETVEVTVGRV
jgi:hypothetical protein